MSKKLRELHYTPHAIKSQPRHTTSPVAEGDNHEIGEVDIRGQHPKSGRKYDEKGVNQYAG